jgi:hypothetical protein
MIIPEIKLNLEEVCEAIGDFLSKRGITVPVESVERNYSGSGHFRVTLKEPEEASAKAELEPETVTEVKP